MTAWRKSGKVVEESLIVTWFIQLLLAVQYMHNRKVMHRDLKTRNVFIRKNMLRIGECLLLVTSLPIIQLTLDNYHPIVVALNFPKTLCHCE